jgi:rfaE bifunctional protein nucleotidyltransferase chain/domain
VINKIKTIEELIKVVEEEKLRGKRVALCHGCFDLVHIGHMKHFNAAKKMADILVVSVTPDRFINKGPGRPVFSENLRLEALANIEAVDFVVLNDSADAVSLIKRLKPSFYVKGSEYKDLSSGMRIKEKQAVEETRGQFVCTEEETFSSSSLINSNFEHLSSAVSEFLKKVRDKYAVKDIEDILEKMSSLRVLIIGDPIIDEYHYCRAVGTTTKFPTISAVYQGKTKMAGASLAIARHAAEFSKSVDYIGIVGDRDNEKDFIEKELSGINNFLIKVPGRYTTVKRRFVAGNYPTAIDFKESPSDNYKLFEIAFMDNSLIGHDSEKQLMDLIEKRIAENDLVILADFGHGMITPGIIDMVREKAKWWAVNAQTNSTNYGFNFITKYKDPDFVCIDEREARLPLGDRYAGREEIVRVICQKTNCKEMMMSMGKDGLVLKADDFYYAPALTLKTIDTVGAGDAVLSIASLCRYLKIDPLATNFLSSVMGALATQIVGNTEPVRKKNIIKFIKGALS